VKTCTAALLCARKLIESIRSEKPARLRPHDNCKKRNQSLTNCYFAYDFSRFSSYYDSAMRNLLVLLIHFSISLFDRSPP
jgi:hypothetical protein